MTRVTVMARMTHTTRITRMTVIARMTHMTPMTRVIHTTLKLCHRITLATAIRPKTLLVLTYQTARLFDDEQCQQANSTDAWQFPWKHAVGDGSLLEELGGSPTSNVR